MIIFQVFSRLFSDFQGKFQVILSQNPGHFHDYKRQMDVCLGQKYQDRNNMKSEQEVFFQIQIKKYRINAAHTSNMD